MHGCEANVVGECGQCGTHTVGGAAVQTRNNKSQGSVNVATFGCSLCVVEVTRCGRTSGVAHFMASTVWV